mmetsp:Transcript_97267/g.279475  ORF Transcript_97267/g.279475 Transcript_97267/m.279475 type:complete len:109 (-) Transcript_97267:261-587(-)
MQFVFPRTYSSTSPYAAGTAGASSNVPIELQTRDSLCRRSPASSTNGSRIPSSSRIPRSFPIPGGGTTPSSVASKIPKFACVADMASSTVVRAADGTTARKLGNVHFH